MNPFARLGLSEPILRVIEELGFEEPSEIQARAVPQLLTDERDFIGLAQTGTGKTAAFGWPLLERIDVSQNYTQALILSPTRELSLQITKELEIFGKYYPKVNTLTVYGGSSIQEQIRALKKPQHIVIATPGRLIDLIKKRAVKLNQIRFLVLDEADEMLNMGFKEELDEILQFTPDSKQTWLFSATMAKDIRRIVDTYMDKPFEVRTNTKNEVNTNIEHQFALVKNPDKAEALMRFMDVQPDLRGVVFCRTRRETQALAEELLRRDYKADAIHGDLPQSQRERVMGRFRDNDIQVLIATDVAARGIDVNDLTHVFNFNIPDDFAYYTHRSGRTARAGKKGISISFLGRRNQGKLDRMGRELGIEFTQVEVPNTEDVMVQRLEHWAKRIVNEKPKGKVTPELFLQISRHFEDLTPTEFLLKIMSVEIDNLKLGVDKDLNDRKQGKKSSSQSNSKPRSKRKFDKPRSETPQKRGDFSKRKRNRNRKKRR